jgi:hypothetical protein
MKLIQCVLHWSIEHHRNWRETPTEMVLIESLVGLISVSINQWKLEMSNQSSVTLYISVRRVSLIPKTKQISVFSQNFFSLCKKMLGSVGWSEAYFYLVSYCCIIFIIRSVCNRMCIYMYILCRFFFNSNQLKCSVDFQPCIMSKFKTNLLIFHKRVFLLWYMKRMLINLL